MPSINMPIMGNKNINCHVRFHLIFISLNSTRTSPYATAKTISTSGVKYGMGGVEPVSISITIGGKIISNIKYKMFFLLIGFLLLIGSSFCVESCLAWHELFIGQISHFGFLGRQIRAPNSIIA